VLSLVLKGKKQHEQMNFLEFCVLFIKFNFNEWKIKNSMCYKLLLVLNCGLA